MVHVFVTQLVHLADDVLAFWLNQLTPVMQNQVSKFKNWQDARRSMLGKVLLIKGLQHLGLTSYTLNQIEYNFYGKPFFKNGPFFNITHSGNYIACAISREHSIGIDIEEIKPIPFKDFDDLFSENEWKKIYNIKSDFTAFYCFWTQKEACIKAIGQGLSIPLKYLEVVNNSIEYDDQVWLLRNLSIHKDYSATLATNYKGLTIEILQIEL